MIARHTELTLRCLNQINATILGKDVQVKMSLACLLAGGHLLIEDVPGVGKTTLAHTLAVTLGLDFHRVQFTSDLLPGDLIGTSIPSPLTGTFEFHPGPLFTELLLADEINRTTPRTQSALLEAMEEGQVTVDGKTHPLPEPFFVVATQNPLSQIGTFPLPQSQLDRFLVAITLGYPDAAAERELLLGVDPREKLRQLPSVLTREDLRDIQALVRGVQVGERLVTRVQELVGLTRTRGDFQVGLSPRAAQGLIRVARAWAFLSGHQEVREEHLGSVFPAVATHRLLGRSSGLPDPARVLALLKDAGL